MTGEVWAGFGQGVGTQGGRESEGEAGTANDAESFNINENQR